MFFCGYNACMFAIKAKMREGGRAARLRETGELPAVFYGLGKTSTPIAVNKIEFKKIWRQAGESSAIKISTPEGDIDALIHEVATDPVTDEPIHADFLVIDLKKAIRVGVPLEWTGISPVVKNGLGTVVKVLYEVEIEALPNDLPHNLSVDISALETLESQILVSDIKLPKGVTMITNSAEIVASVAEQKEEKEEVAVAPDLSAIEVEKKGKKEEEAPTPEGVGVPTSDTSGRDVGKEK